MAYYKFDSLYRAITVIDAQETLKQIKIACFPTTKQEQRKAIHKELHKKAYPNAHENKPILSMEQAMSALGGLNG